MRALRWLVVILQVGSLAALAQQSQAWAQQSDLDSLRRAAGNSSTPRIVNEAPLSAPANIEPRNTAPASDTARAGEATDARASDRSPSQAVSPRAPQQIAADKETEFQRFVQQSTGRELPLFGHNFFTMVPSTFVPLDDVAVPADYTIGPGDEIVVRAWGQIDIDYRARVDRNGTLYIPKIGEIPVAGLKFVNLNSYIRAAVSRIYKNFELYVSLGELRSIQIFIVGQARRPGGYVVGSLSTLVNALFASGGPSYRGSMRNIQLKRSGKVVTEFDLYDLLLNGDISKDAKLLPADVIYIPPVGALAAVGGSVQVPAIYELKARTTLGDAIDMAGGLATTAAAQKLTIERIMNRETRFIEEFTVSTSDTNQKLRDGDIVNVYTLSPRITNAVTLRGNVAETMRFPWRERMKVSDIIPERDSLIVPDYWLRKNKAGRPESWLRSERGAATADAETLRRELVRGGVEINWDYAVIERLNMAALEPTLIPFNLGKAVLEKDKQHDLLLLPGDVITVFSADDIRVPKSRRSHFVRRQSERFDARTFEAFVKQLFRHCSRS